MLKVSTIDVYGLGESLIASGYPMVAEEAGLHMNNCLQELSTDDGGHFKRCKKLGNVPSGSGHDNFLKGVLVQFNVKYPQYWAPQAQRYHWFDIVSSQSKMHCITKMDIAKCCNKYVDKLAIENLEYWVGIYNEFKLDKVWIEQCNKDKYQYLPADVFVRGFGKSYTKYEVFMKIISNTPMGFEMTMRVTTNYLQLKTIYFQRKNHKLKEDWGTFCKFIEKLPYFKEFCLEG